MKATRLDIVRLEDNNGRSFSIITSAARALVADLAVLRDVSLPPDSLLSKDAKLTCTDIDGRTHSIHFGQDDIISLHDAVARAISGGKMREGIDFAATVGPVAFYDNASAEAAVRGEAFYLDLATGEVSPHVTGPIVPRALIADHRLWMPLMPANGPGIAWTLEGISVAVYRVNHADIVLDDNTRIEGPVYYSEIAAQRAAAVLPSPPQTVVRAASHPLCPNDGGGDA